MVSDDIYRQNWFRSEIIGVDKSKDMVEVFYIDTGKKCGKNFVDLCILPPNFISIKAQVYLGKN